MCEVPFELLMIRIYSRSARLSDTPAN